MFQFQAWFTQMSLHSPIKVCRMTGTGISVCTCIVTRTKSMCRSSNAHALCPFLLFPHTVHKLLSSCLLQHIYILIYIIYSIVLLCHFWLNSNQRKCVPNAQSGSKSTQCTLHARPLCFQPIRNGANFTRFHRFTSISLLNRSSLGHWET